MPGPDAAYAPEEYGVQDLYPKNEAEHAELLGWVSEAFTAARSARNTREAKWKKYHRLYRSYVERKSTDWRSAVFVPYAFSTIESITPRMVAQLPSFVVLPMTPEDVEPAKTLEQLLGYCADQTNLHLQLTLGIKSSLKYGTGILKTYFKQDIRRAREQVPVMEMVEAPGASEPMLDEQGQPMFNVDGLPQTQEIPGQPTEQPKVDPLTGQPVMEWKPYEYVLYEGPAAEWVDVFNFWIAPEANDLDDARYTIQRSYRPLSYVEKKIKDGVYRLPKGITAESLVSSSEEDAENQRRQEVQEDSTIGDTTRKPVEILEIWTDDNRVITTANMRAILRVSENPFDHGEKPYVHIPDYLQEGDFWGIGEVESMEGLQDLANALINQRIDNVRLTMDAMITVNTKAIEDERDMVLRPGGIIRVSGDYLPDEAMKRLDLGDVTSSAFAEASEVERMIERVTGVSAYQLGQDSDSTNSTATGVAILQEAGNSKFSMKVKMLELVALKRLARHWGSIIQQFTTEERLVRIMGPQGEYFFQSLQPDSLAGEFDYNVETASTTQTESVKKQQAMELLTTVAPYMPTAVPALVQDLFETWGKKDLVRYMAGTPSMNFLMQLQNDPMIQAQQQQQDPNAQGGQGQTAQGQPPDPTQQQPQQQGQPLPL